MTGPWAGFPPEEIPPPAALGPYVGDDPCRAVWSNELGGVTFEIGSGTGRRFAKWSPAGAGPDLRREAARMRWAAIHTAVPEVLDVGASPEGTWLITTALPGETAVSERWKRDPAVAVKAIGLGLRSFHDALPVTDCPFDWSADARLASARSRAEAGLLQPTRWGDGHRHLTVDEALSRLADIPPVDHLVVCHGDTCAPNTLIGEDGHCTGHLDLGDLGVADRWADIAIATWSLDWNYGPGWEAAMLDVYGIDPDRERTTYYRLLWDLGP